MKKNTWILWALILMVAGAIGLGYHHAQRKALNDRIAQAARITAENPATEEYLAMYHRWISLPPEEKAENPWGQDPYGGPEIQKRLKDGQSARLLADVPDLDKGLKQCPEELAEVLYGYGWRSEVELYRSECKKAEAIFIATVFIFACSGVIIAGGTGNILLSYCLGRIRRSREEARQVIEKHFEETLETDDDSELPEQPDQTEPQAETEDTAQSAADAEDTPNQENQKETPPSTRGSPGYFESIKKGSNKSETSTAAPEAGKKSLSELSTSVQTMCDDKPSKDPYFGWAVDADESSSLESLMTTEPLTKELTELTEEVSAIRQFAAQQQDQVRKLQDGYDWMIIRRFCMRVIRSIDNIDDRINRLNESDSELTMCLEDIRDELVFGLESSGIEQFNPDLKTPFKGLEKYVEAVRQRVLTEDESLIGCIAEIARPGYQYLINDDDVKIVRCAQVKLYDAK
ncbi:MAG: hypothetical protein H8E62_05505 [Planctomycetes bacterium]|nr:hypothetical protein [Planctomycetota bacterium]